MSSEKFCIQWNNFEKDFSSAFRSIREDKDFFDITIVCEDEQIEAHKVILSACSPFFKNMLRRNQHQHPLLYMKGVSYRDMEAVLNFMYHGEVNIAQEDLNSFLQVAEDLSVKGLTQQNNICASSSPHPQPPASTSDISPEKDNLHPPVYHPQSPSTMDAKLEPEVEVKSEPDQVTPSQQGSMEMFEDVSHMMSMDTGGLVEYGGNYGDHQGHLHAGQDGGLQGKHHTIPLFNSFMTIFYFTEHNKVQCDICFKVIHKHTLNRHKKYQHGTSNPVQCNLCEKIFKNEGTLKGHLRQSHKIYQTSSQDGVGKPVKTYPAGN